MITLEVLLYIMFGFSVLFGFISFFYMCFSTRTLYFSSSEMELSNFITGFFRHIFYSSAEYSIVACILSGTSLLFHILFLTDSSVEISLITKSLMLVVSLISVIATVFASEDFVDFEFKNSESNAKQLLGNLMYKKLKKTYCSDTASLIKLLQIKSAENSKYEPDKVPLQQEIQSLSSLVIENRHNSGARNIIEKELKSTEFIDLSGPLLNILTNEELFNFVKTEKGSYSIKAFVEELRLFIYNLNQELTSVTSIKEGLTEAEMILELERLTKTKLSKEFSTS